MLTNEEIATRIQDGQKDLMPLLWERVERFARQQVKRSVYGKQLEDDLFQSAYIALASAVERFDESKAAFLTWNAYYLRTAFAEAAGCRRGNDPMRGALSLDTPLPGTEEFTLADTIADPSDPIAVTENEIWHEELHAAMQEALDALPDDLREVIRQRYYNTRTVARIAAATGHTPAEVNTMERRAIRQIRQERRLRAFAYSDADIYSAGLRGVGVRAFVSNHTSCTENAVLRMESGQL